MGEGGLTLTFHGVQITLSVMVLGILLREHKTWVRLKDRVNSLWFRHCRETGERFESLNNGK